MTAQVVNFNYCMKLKSQIFSRYIIKESLFVFNNQLRALYFQGATWPAAHMLAVTWFKPRQVSSFVSCYTAVNLGYAVVGILGTMLVRVTGRDSISYLISVIALLWYCLWWRFVEESLSLTMPKRDVSTLTSFLQNFSVFKIVSRVVPGGRKSPCKI